MNIGRHPAIGLGELLPGWFAVPQNPMDGPVTYIRGIGDILGTGGFTVPQNPVVSRASGVIQPIGTAPGQPAQLNNKPVTSGMGCGCSGKSCECSGLGDISAEFTQLTTDLTSGNFVQALSTDTLFGLPVWGYVVAVAALMFVGGEKHSYAGRTKRAARAAAGAF